ncbi:MAG: type II toxin-antitoxin system CcdA family antitoxin [Woeseiaceae bacterium]|nr:type II toxin-antitoxin system CcdA family antitoxin [Woeseiaceae bacterium]
MKSRPYDHNAPKRTVSLTINTDLFAQAKGYRINASRVAEEALAYEVARRKAEALGAEIRQDLEACNAYAEQHGLFADRVREHYQQPDDDEPV